MKLLTQKSQLLSPSISYTAIVGANNSSENRQSYTNKQQMRTQ